MRAGMAARRKRKKAAMAVRERGCFLLILSMKRHMKIADLVQYAANLSPKARAAK